MTFNIRYGSPFDGANHWSRRRELVFGVFRRHQPDVVGVQEALRSQMEDIRKALPAYRHVGRTREANAGRGEAVPIFFRHERWKVAESGTFWLSDTPEVPGSRSWGNTLPRIATWARLVEKAGGRAVCVFNVHLDHRSQPAREKSAALVVQRMHAVAKAAQAKGEAVRLILTGDFNAGESNPAVRHLKGRRGPSPLPLADTFRIRHPKATGVGTFGAWAGRTSGAKIDYVFVRPGAKVLAARILHDNADGCYPSDHFPVLAEIEF